MAREQQETIGRAIRSMGVDLLELSTDVSYIPPLLGFFKTRMRRAGR
jgi:hypothetical protein